ncbi:MAG: bifunctional hydroxymethylpyrimidine kinase/phosphomethylpyrimidine kinase [Methanomicrobiales archaeon]|nr:bifunctional hydroxymethylpyrimidine kinase/phosphomethylpyrimidine kinase [Methanomicrobiales archaeon]
MADEMACACTIAGSDSSGGAGIQADLKTFTAIGVWGVTVVTAVTAQNTRTVMGLWRLPAEAVVAQLAAVLEDFPIGAIKTGLLCDRETIHALHDYLPRDIPLVLDPVMISTTGYTFLKAEAIQEIKDHLIPRTTIITPNLTEAATLAGMETIRSLDDVREAARRILNMGPRAVIVKGGHLPGREAMDFYMDRQGEEILKGERFPYEVHGTGCCFAAALAAYLALGCDERGAFQRSKAFVAGAIERALPAARSGRRAVQPELPAYEEGYE